MVTSSRGDFEASVRLFTTEENCSVGLVCGALRSDLGILAEESRVVLLEALALHVGGDDAILHTLESVTNRVSCVQLALVSTVEEPASVGLILRSRITHFILEELLLCRLECRILTHVLGHAGHGVFGLALLAARLLKLRVAQLCDFGVFFAAVELSIGFHHRLLLVLG